MPFFLDFRKLIRQDGESKTAFSRFDVFPCLDDRFEQSGSARGHYFHQDLFVAGQIFQNSPSLHVDIGSRVDGFVAHIASFRKIQVFDIRALRLHHKNIEFVQCNLMTDIPLNLINYCDSLSCLHALEHFGLGRYGDPIDIDGHLRGLRNIVKILKPGGRFYFSAPIGRVQRIEFNAHRVFSLRYLIELFESDFEVESISCVDDNGDFYPRVSPTKSEVETSYGYHYGCGIFELKKKVLT